MNKPRENIVYQIVSYDDVEVEVMVGHFIGTEEEIQTLVNEEFDATLKEDGLHFKFGASSSIITIEEKEKYIISVCTKELPPPVDISEITEEQMMTLFEDERYMISADDFETVQWDLSELFVRLKKNKPQNNVFEFESLSYRVEEIN